MRVDAFVRFAVNETGENTWIVDYQANDIQLNDYFSEFVSTDDIDTLISLKEVEANLKARYGEEMTLNNKLLLATFSYRSVSSFNGEHTEWDDCTEVIDVLVLDHDYKGTWQKNLTTMYNHYSLEDLQNEEATSATETVESLGEVRNDLAEWEEFYDEDFSFFQPKQVSALELLLK